MDFIEKFNFTYSDYKNLEWEKEDKEFKFKDNMLLLNS